MRDSRENVEKTLLVQFLLDGHTFEEEGRWVARCPKLRLSASGTTAEEAFERWQSVFAVYFESCIRHGSVFRVFKKAGIGARVFSSSGERLDFEGLEESQAKSISPVIMWEGTKHARSSPPAG